MIPPRGERSFRSTALAVIAFGVAMGYLEGAVVVYLRAAIDAGAVTPVIDASVFARYEAIEVARELATMVMIGAVGWLAGASRLERLAWAAVVFGAWDIVYYIALRLAIGWPASIADWDVLFLIPIPWVGPVWAPVMVSLALIGVGHVAARQLRLGRPLLVTARHIAAGLVAGGLVIASFLVDTERIIAGDTAPWTGWPLYWAGMALASAAVVSALRTGRVRPARPTR
ncbi:MAG: hypothetical protein EPO36_07180 [Chloroflexota bacterium]|nr:MAG: hypothetical protein EPO36_07180 [Chloroflexota bacterium]